MPILKEAIDRARQDPMPVFSRIGLPLKLEIGSTIEVLDPWLLGLSCSNFSLKQMTSFDIVSVPSKVFAQCRLGSPRESPNSNRDVLRIVTWF